MVVALVAAVTESVVTEAVILMEVVEALVVIVGVVPTIHGDGSHVVTKISLTRKLTIGQILAIAQLETYIHISNYITMDNSWVCDISLFGNHPKLIPLFHSHRAALH